MSEEIDSAQSHLCTTEDAFEQFQSVSMYEEDEYITLSDIVPPQPPVPDLACELSDIPYENEVVLDSNLEEQVPEVNSTIEIGSEDLRSSEETYSAAEQPGTDEPSLTKHQETSQKPSYVAEHQETVEEPSAIAEYLETFEEDPHVAPTESRPSKRGRKKKTPLFRQISQRHNKLEKQDNGMEEMPVAPLTTPRRRGRPPKKYLQENNITGAPTINDFHTPDNLPKRTNRRTASRRMSQNNDTDMDNTPSGKPITKRGKPKKSEFDQQMMDIDISSSVPQNNSLSEEPITSPPDIPVQKKRGRKKKSMENNVSSNAPEESQVIHEQSDFTMEECVNDTAAKDKKAKKKKGRNKKTHTVEKPVTKADNFLETNDDDLKNDCNEDVDDICLSQLKTSLEEAKDSNTITEALDGSTTITETLNGSTTIIETSSENIEEDDNEICTESNETLINKQEKIEIKEETPTKRNSKIPIMADYEYNIDSIVKKNKEEIVKTQSQLTEDNLDEPLDSLLVEDTSKRPCRRKAKQTLRYDEESDEDPFANVELSDDEPGKKGYYSDDEYVPETEKKRGSKKKASLDSDTSDSDIDKDDYEIRQLKRKKTMKLDGSPCKKRGRKPDTTKHTPEVSTIKPLQNDMADDDIEICLDTSVIKAPSELNSSWKSSNEFENFLAKKIQGTEIKIKKSTASVLPLEIPVIDPKEAKKGTEVSTQTAVVQRSAAVQTTTLYDVPMKDNIPLTAEQSEKACEFLNSIVKTTAELGQLMTQKSEDFIKKKINTTHVTDTFKMDYCVRKSFLLFKLAKHNLMQMEEDLANQYDSFLNTHNLSQHREKPKVFKVEAEKAKDSDSDCEIIETPVSLSKPKKTTPKPAFNPKTVFLNKELSIKIAKKPSDDKKLDIKGRHTVWINDSVMVKKVKPTQSFLAQDSRNKKPPDYVTLEMVKKFFEQYYRQKALITCAPFVSSQWGAQERLYVCGYFFSSADEYPKPSGSEHCENNNSNISDVNDNFPCSMVNTVEKFCPSSLFSLCTKVLKYHFHPTPQNILPENSENTPNVDKYYNPDSLFGLCLNIFNTGHSDPDQRKDVSYDTVSSIISDTSLISDFDVDDAQQITNYETVASLKSICHKKMVSLLHIKSQPITIESNPDSPLPNCDKIILNDEIMTKQDVRSVPYFQENHVKPLFSQCLDLIHYHLNKKEDETFFDDIEIPKKHVKSLFTQCFDFIHHHLSKKEDEIFFDDKEIRFMPKTLRNSAYKCVVDLIYKNQDPILSRSQEKEEVDYLSHSSPPNIKTLSSLSCEIVTRSFADCLHILPEEGLTINAVNTLTEEAYHNIEQTELSENGDDYYADEDYDNETETGFNNIDETIHTEDDSHADENNWLSQLQVKVSSCYNSTEPISPVEEQINVPISKEPGVAQIKIEPPDEGLEQVAEPSIVKTEPLHHLDEMTIIPENVITKTEFLDAAAASRSAPIERHNSSSYDVDSFEAFVSTNKMMCHINNYSDKDDEVFTQSALRIRRQFEPDLQFDTDIDVNMSLLIPQTFEPMPVIENKAKDILMESSSDESSSNKKTSATKKKPEKRGRKSKKIELKAANSKELQKEKLLGKNEVAMLTRRMRDKIRQEEKKIASSDSDNDSETVLSKKGKDKFKEVERENASDPESVNVAAKKGKEKAKENTEKAKTRSSKVEESDKPKENTKDAIKKLKSQDQSKDLGVPDNEEIQCNNVDSTEQDNDRTASPSVNNFSGFSAVDQNEISSYHKYVKFVYDQIIPKDSEQPESPSIEHFEQPLINPDEPVELLECEPTMPFLMEESPGPRPKSKKVKSSKKVDIKVLSEQNEESASINKDQIIKDEIPLYVERHGWKCYPLNSDDSKLYQNAQIVLEKLPESFVETYFKYQDITEKNPEDEEVDKLINLQTLNRPALKEGKCKGRPKSKILPQGKDSVQDSISNLGDRSRSPSPAASERYDELTPSEDEGGKVDEEPPPPISKPTTENNLAKNSLMDDHDSGDETLAKIKEEPKDLDIGPSEVQDKGPSDVQSSSTKKYKPGPKSKKNKELSPSVPVMLTADKMMNKELNLLHAPIKLEEENEPIATPAKKGPATRKQKSTSKRSPKDQAKAEDDSSSEEEKQWFTIKEKLLKRMVKKNDTTREDDAKRAKLVSEFIERRGDGTESYLNRRRGGAGRPKRSKKKMLERQKQLKVLTRELFGDASNDASLQQKRKVTAAYFKGRRNIRKVIDKKSLAKSTVVANMEEFERKRRLNIKQSRLREVLKCDEGVNVLVINDEVCLEYDFEKHRPVVTIHPFFTKVMKAHQYEGVKFMWDACFESLDSIAAGRGGGCILAHCMGLGKTLQVLALLHTVLTHPGVGMHRVLVCCPLSTVLNWVDEIHKWIGPVTNQIKVFELSKLRKTYERAYQLEDWYNGGGIFIIGYELFRSLTTLDPFLDDVRPTIVKKIRTALLDPGPDIIICDEGHLLKNDCSVLAVAMSRVVTKRRIVLTGTPMQNNLREYYCMVNFVKPNLLGTYSEYSNRFENPIMNGQHRDSQEDDIKLMKARTHILHKVLEGCLQRQEASVLYPYLPKKHEYTVFISLTKCQWDLYKHYLNNYGNLQNNKSILKDFHILQKIWSHPQVLHNFQMRSDEIKARTKLKMEKLEDDLANEDLNATEDIKPTDTEVWWLQYLEGGAMLETLTSSNKFATVFRILDESVALGDKVLIFSTSLFTMDALEYFLKKMNNWSLGQEYYRLDGSVPAEVRQKWCREFNAEHNVKTKLFLISTRAGSLGLNMTAANRVIILDTSWNPAHDIQSIFRVYRFGQKKDCYIYRLVALGTMEQKIYERSVTKQAVACRVVDEQQIDRHYNMAELTELYKFDETGVGVAGGVAVGVEDVVLLRVARDAALHAVHEHDSLLRGSHEQSLPEHERNAAWMQFQQEHAHKQMQEEALQQELLLKQEELAKAIALKPPKKQYAKLKIKIPELKKETEESILPEPVPKIEVPPPVHTSRRGRKAKKNNVVSCCIPIQPETAEPEDKDAEMVQKIADILLRHNFKSHQTPAEISALATRVRTIVDTGQVDQLDSSDALTMSIANVMLQESGHTIHMPMQMPALTDIACEEIITSDPTPPIFQEESNPKPPPKPRGRKKGVKRKGYVYEEIPSTSTATPLPEPEEVGSRTRRRAAIAAEKNFDTVVDAAVDVGDNDWQNDDDYETPISEINRENEMDSTPFSDDKGVANEVVVKTEPSNESAQISFKAYDRKSLPKLKQNSKPIPESESILLSDDDEPPPPPRRKKPGPAQKTLNLPPKEPEVQLPKDPDVGVVPLHASLLSNKNFIKIVAHTYLSGNPMLDEDAATLAAQYSTFKALKEYASTGEDIKSGPIYDIAVKILGIGVLKKLHNSNVKLDTSEIIASHPLSAQDSSIPKEVQSKVGAQPAPVKEAAPPAPELRELKPVRLKIRIPPLPANMAAASNVPISTADQGNVVPIGLYKRAEDPTPNADECILPDDDIHITSDPSPSPAPPAPPPAPPLAPIVLSRRNARRLLLNKVVSSTTQQHSPPQPPPPPPLGVVPLSQMIAKAPEPSERILSDLSAPISLDSDDDEPVPRPPPVPVSLSAAKQAHPRPGPSGPNAPVVLQNQTSTSSTVNSLAVVGGNIILMPSYSSCPPVPVALSQGPIYTSPQMYLPPAPPPPVPVQLPPLVVTKPPPAPPAQPLNLNKTVCKAGDIFRITDSGKIEVLNRKDLALEASGPATAPSKAAKAPPAPKVPPPPAKAPPAPKAPPPAAKAPPLAPKLAPAPPKPAAAPASTKLPDRTTLRKASSSSSCSDDDPLSILRNVVHIEADTNVRTDVSQQDSSKTNVSSKQDTNVRTNTKQTTKLPAPPARAKAPTQTPKKTQIDMTADIPTIDLDETSDEQWHQVLSHNTSAPTKRTTRIVIAERMPTKASTNNSSVSTPPAGKTTVSKPSVSKTPVSKPPVSKTPVSKPPVSKTPVSKPPVNKTPVSKSREQKLPVSEQKNTRGNVFDSVDLTDLDWAPETAKVAVNKTYSVQKKATTIVGTSKSIILCGSGKAKLSTAANKREPVAKQSNVEQAVTPKVELKKRPAPVEVSAAKKKKTDKPMTLKDFDIDIDDIDDIIELD